MCINDCGEPDPDCLVVGEECASGADCAEGMCGDVDGEKLCTRTCTADSECPEGYECRGDTACWPKEPDGCSGGGGAPARAPWLLLALAAMGLRLGRRGPRRPR
jgi:hypothetical protein